MENRGATAETGLGVNGPLCGGKVYPNLLGAIATCITATVLQGAELVIWNLLGITPGPNASISPRGDAEKPGPGAAGCWLPVLWEPEGEGRPTGEGLVLEPASHVSGAPGDQPELVLTSKGGAG